MRKNRCFRRAGLYLGLLCLAMAGCGTPAPGTVTVFAASSLTDVMEKLTKTYAGAQPGTQFAVNYGSSTQLVQQLKSGARPGVLVTADRAAMDALAGTGLLAGTTDVIATNDITIALAPGNPANIDSLSDLGRAGTTVARCAPGVPCGRAAERVLDAAGLQLEQPASEDSVRSVLTKVATGQVDAGLVYTTDALAAREQGVTSIPLKNVEPNEYPAALTAYGADDQDAVDFQQWLTGAHAGRILREAGFGE